MAHPRRFRFGVQASTAASGDDWRALARRVEDLGYSTLFMPDHFGDQLAPVPALMAAADATSELRIGALVFDNDYKHPVVLAKEAATLDLLSGGRLELGVGAGWMVSDYEQAGMAYDPPKVRVDRFAEGLAVIKGLFAEGELHFEGEHYRIEGLDGRPKPVARPHPPILIGGGAKRMLSIAAREADIVGINPTVASGQVDAAAAADTVASAWDRKVAWVRAAAGARFDDLEINCLTYTISVTDDRQAISQRLAPAFGVDAAEVPTIPHAFVGTVDQICDDLEWKRDRWGVSYFVVQAASVDACAPIVARMAGA